MCDPVMWISEVHRYAIYSEDCLSAPRSGLHCARSLLFGFVHIVRLYHVTKNTKYTLPTYKHSRGSTHPYIQRCTYTWMVPSGKTGNLRWTGKPRRGERIVWMRVTHQPGICRVMQRYSCETISVHLSHNWLLRVNNCFWHQRELTHAW